MRALTIILITLLVGSGNLLGQVTNEQDSIYQKPSITLSGIAPGRLSAETFKKQTKLIIPKGYTLKKLIVDFMIPGNSIERYNLFSPELSPLQDVMNRCIPGTVVWFEKIFTVDEKGQTTFLSNAGFALF